MMEMLPLSYFERSDPECFKNLELGFFPALRGQLVRKHGFDPKIKIHSESLSKSGIRTGRYFTFLNI